MSFRERFVVADPDVIYLDGNSLGRLPIKTPLVLQEAIEEWGQDLVGAWPRWFELPQKIGAKLARAIGAQAHEVLCCDSTSVNFYKLVTAVLKLQKGRTKIVTEETNFPSDLYLLQGLSQDIEVVKSPDGIHLPFEEIEKVLDERTALLTLSHVNFRSGFRHDIKRLTQAAHAKGVMVLWDLSHSVGAMPIDLSEADFAVGCTYKYLNGGPGGPAFLYVNERHQEAVRNPIQGWFGQNRPFDFGLEYEPAPGLDRMLVGTPPILSMLAVEVGVDLVLEAGLDNLRQTSERQTELMVRLWQEHLEPLGVQLKSPQDKNQRGSHIALAHEKGYAIDRALIETRKVIPDFRPPNNIRFGFSPLYTTDEEIIEATQRMKEVIETKAYEAFDTKPSGVT